MPAPSACSRRTDVAVTPVAPRTDPPGSNRRRAPRGRASRAADARRGHEEARRRARRNGRPPSGGPEAVTATDGDPRHPASAGAPVRSAAVDQPVPGRAPGAWASTGVPSPDSTAAVWPDGPAASASGSAAACRERRPASTASTRRPGRRARRTSGRRRGGTRRSGRRGPTAPPPGPRCRRLRAGWPATSPTRRPGGRTARRRCWPDRTGCPWRGPRSARAGVVVDDGGGRALEGHRRHGHGRLAPTADTSDHHQDDRDDEQAADDQPGPPAHWWMDLGDLSRRGGRLNDDSVEASADPGIGVEDAADRAVGVDDVDDVGVCHHPARRCGLHASRRSRSTPSGGRPGDPVRKSQFDWASSPSCRLKSATVWSRPVDGVGHDGDEADLGGVGAEQRVGDPQLLGDDRAVRRADRVEEGQDDGVAPEVGQRHRGPSGAVRLNAGAGPETSTRRAVRRPRRSAGRRTGWRRRRPSGPLPPGGSRRRAGVAATRPAPPGSRSPPTTTARPVGPDVPVGGRW